MKPSEILEAAAMHIRKFGHIKGTSGYGGGPCCIIGAISRGGFGYYQSKTAAMTILGRVIYGRKIEFLPSSELALWNDRPETTPGAAFNALWAAAKLARSEGR